MFPKLCKVEVTTPILQMGKLRLKEMIQLAQSKKVGAHGVGIQIHISVC